MRASSPLILLQYLLNRWISNCGEWYVYFRGANKMPGVFWDIESRCISEPSFVFVLHCYYSWDGRKTSLFVHSVCLHLASNLSCNSPWPVNCVDLLRSNHVIPSFVCFRFKIPMPRRVKINPPSRFIVMISEAQLLCKNWLLDAWIMVRKRNNSLPFQLLPIFSLCGKFIPTDWNFLFTGNQNVQC